MSWFGSLFRRTRPAPQSAPVNAQDAKAPEARFGRSGEPRGWSSFAASIGSMGMSETVEPQLLLCCKTPRMAEALLARRPSATDAFLRGKPSLVEFDDGTAAACFPFQKGNDLSAFVDELFKGHYGDENVEIVSGLAAAAPADQVKRVIGLFGAKEGMRLGNVAWW